MEFLLLVVGPVVNIIMALLLGHDHGHGHGHSDHGHRHEFQASTHHHHHGVKHPKDCHHHTREDHVHHQTPEEEVVAMPLLGGSKEKEKRWNTDVQGAYLHVLGDSVQSVGVVIGGAIIWHNPEWQIVDLICTLVFSVVVLGTTINMLRSIVEVLMESTPREIEAAKLERELLDMEEVMAVHELHIWAITVGKVLLACHVKIRPEVCRHSAGKSYPLYQKGL
ncbi:Metal tolerance protein 1 [Spatholobus suberectus]|nr:Metal tolerance protein 1 [Spatholobus suberectus]